MTTCHNATINSRGSFTLLFQLADLAGRPATQEDVQILVLFVYGDAGEIPTFSGRFTPAEAMGDVNPADPRWHLDSTGPNAVLVVPPSACPAAGAYTAELIVKFTDGTVIPFSTSFDATPIRTNVEAIVW